VGAARRLGRFAIKASNSTATHYEYARLTGRSDYKEMKLQLEKIELREIEMPLKTRLKRVSARLQSGAL
jgi:hypothetical protein